MDGAKYADLRKSGDGEAYVEWRGWEIDLLNGKYDKKPQMEAPTREEALAESIEEKNDSQITAPKRTKLQTERWEPTKQEYISKKRHQQQIFKNKERSNSMEAAFGDVPETEEDWQNDVAERMEKEEAAKFAEQNQLSR